MNITKQIFKKTVLVGTIALSIAVFAGCSDSANSSTADTTKPTDNRTGY
jgi:V8-like Glu-specific endopeptidase